MKIAVVCGKCKTVVKGDDGYLCVDWIRAMARRDAFASLEGLTNHGALMDIGKEHPEVIWGAWHRSCDPDGDAVDYWISASDLCDIDGVLHWNEHLNQKNWVSSTDWNRMLASIPSATVRLTVAKEGQ